MEEQPPQPPPQQQQQQPDNNNNNNDDDNNGNNDNNNEPAAGRPRVPCFFIHSQRQPADVAAAPTIMNPPLQQQQQLPPLVANNNNSNNNNNNKVVAIRQDETTLAVANAQRRIQQQREVNDRLYKALFGQVDHKSPDLAQARRALRDGANINMTVKKHSLLDLAIANNLDDIMYFLLGNPQLNLDVIGPDGLTPLLRAVRNLNHILTEILLRAGANVNVLSQDGHETSLLEVAVRWNNVPFAKALIEYGANVNLRGRRQRTPIFHVSSAQMLQYLLRKGAQVNVADQIGWTPLHLVDVNAPGWQHHLHILIHSGGGNVDIQCGTEQRTPLHWACYNSLAAVQWLVQNGGARTHLRDAEGKTPLHYACYAKQRETVFWLIDHCHVDVYTESHGHFNALHYVCLPLNPLQLEDETVALADELLEKYPKLAISHAGAWDALHCAALWSPKLLKLLVEKYNFDALATSHSWLTFPKRHFVEVINIDLSALRKDLISILDIAVVVGTASALEYITELKLKQGIALDVTDGHLLETAILHSQVDKVRLLLQGGCNPNNFTVRSHHPFTTDRLLQPDSTLSVVPFVVFGMPCQMLELLLNHGAKSVVREGNTSVPAAFYWASSGNLNAIFLTLRHAATTEGLFEKQHRPTTTSAVMTAVVKKRVAAKAATPKKRKAIASPEQQDDDEEEKDSKRSCHENCTLTPSWLSLVSK